MGQVCLNEPRVPKQAYGLNKATKSHDGDR